jgi:hypothetical protein
MMPGWLRIALVVLGVWAALSLLQFVLGIAAFLGGLLALPLAVLAGYLVWKKGGFS